MRTRGLVCQLMIVTLSLFVAGSQGAGATDYSHDCSSSDGQWKMWDESLSAAGDGNQTDIPYTTLKDTVLSRKEGYCLSRGQKFGYEAKTYVRRIRFGYQGQTYELDMLCEMASDGLPAAYSCEKEVVTLDTGTTSGTSPGRQDGNETIAYWSHNGSVMMLEANGEARIFSYDKPRSGMRKAGAKRGDILFEGKRQGDRYFGTAYIFSKTCGRKPYAVSGNVEEGERAVVLEGEAPLLDDGCNVTGSKRDVLRFDYVKR